MTIAITGATGRLGRATIAALKARGANEDIVALARHPEQAGDLGVAVRPFDYDAPHMLTASLEGVERLLLISSNEPGRRGEQHRAVIRAAAHAGVELLVYTSILHAASSPISLAGEHRETEADLHASRLPWVVLRNSWYSENFMGQVTRALARGTYRGATGDALITSAPCGDYAQAAAAVLLGSAHTGRTYELTGDVPFTLTDLCVELTRQSGLEVRYENLLPAHYAVALREEGLTAEAADFVASIDAAVARGALYDVSRDLSSLIGRPTTSLATVVAKTMTEHHHKDAGHDGL